MQKPAFLVPMGRVLAGVRTSHSRREITACTSPLQRRDVAVNVGNDHGAGAHGGRDAAHRVGAEVAGHEHAGHRRLRVVGDPAAVGLEQVTGLGVEVAAAQDVALGQRDRAVQPHGVGNRADHGEELVGEHLALPLGGAQDEPLQSVVADQAGDLALGVHLDVAALLDLLDEVVRHLQVEALAADHDVHGALGAVRQVNGRLAGAVGAADDEQFLVGVAVLERGRPVGHTVAQVGHDVGDGEPTVAHAGGEHDRTGGELVTGVVDDGDESGVPVTADAAGHDRGEHLGAEAPSLLDHPVGQVLARHAAGEAGVVLDVRAGTGLAPETLVAVEQQRVDLLTAGVDRGRKSGRAATDDDEIASGHCSTFPVSGE